MANNIYKTLPKPFFVLAPMDDVTDTVFRRIVASCAPPDLYFTEFVNVDGLQSPGAAKLQKKVQFTPEETPLILQLWGKNPENYYKTAHEYEAKGYAGIDLNMGCPVKAIVNNGCCSALINNRELALEIIQATRAGAPSLPLSVKTRLGFNEVDLTWHELLLSQKLNALTIHGRTKQQLSAVPADWETIGRIRQLRDELSPATKIIGNGDVLNRKQGEELAKKYKLDGIMIGRGVFHDPYVFTDPSNGGSPWESFSKPQKIDLYKRHIQLFADTWQQGERDVHSLNKFCKIYINGFDGAKEVRETLMKAATTTELLTILSNVNAQ